MNDKMDRIYLANAYIDTLNALFINEIDFDRLYPIYA